ncbi:hypothetical protein [Acinetobacter pollinis]|jgi:hypothetical protein|uniref:Uncharacterized protein n=1 Tax=Acinetobacter pollinis TaxID=2605270 RepID=A0ABU6DSG4_9GAMM|nr:hypothetical protein [Acinetobacter pollinis]MEB5476786.1 hypothetical protein [Acinetobacter pollinis]
MNKLFLVGLFLLGSAQINIVQAGNIGDITVKTATSNYNLTMRQVWSMHWSPAFNKCRANYPQTKSVQLQRFVLNEQMSPANLFSLWTCRDTK